MAGQRAVTQGFSMRQHSSRHCAGEDMDAGDDGFAFDGKVGEKKNITVSHQHLGTKHCIGGSQRQATLRLYKTAR